KPTHFYSETDRVNSPQLQQAPTGKCSHSLEEFQPGRLRRLSLPFQEPWRSRKEAPDSRVMFRAISSTPIPTETSRHFRTGARARYLKFQVVCLSGALTLRAVAVAAPAP